MQSPVTCGMEQGTATWWAGSTGYQIYLRSFADSNGDGIGDLAGIQSRLDYLRELGIDFIWITPFYPSPMADWGYDVADYCDVDPTFGTLEGFDALVADARDHDIQVVIDLVPNHTSDQHAWFQSARTGPESPYRDHYVWADPAPDGGPPNNWVSYFGGPAWTLDEASGQYYLHLFLPEQPDLNWRNPEVATEFDHIIRFWLDRGVAGFRIDVAGGLVKDRELRSNPAVTLWDPEGTRWEQWEAFDHLHDVFQPESAQIFRRWWSIADEYGAFLHGETYTLDPRSLAELVPGDGMHGGYWFGPMHIDWQSAQIRRTLMAPASLLGDRLLWATSSHDMPRSPTRFGGGDHGRARTLALNVLISGLPGVQVLYQGEELGLVDGDVPADAKLDPVGPDGDVAAGRDGCRSPMPWTPGTGNGFTPGDAWLRSAQRGDDETATLQVADPDSWFNQYRQLLETRRGLGDLSSEPVKWTDTGEGPVLSYRRGSIAVAANTSGGSRFVDVGSDAELAYTTPGVCMTGTDGLELPEYGAAIWRERQ